MYSCEDISPAQRAVAELSHLPFCDITVVREDEVLLTDEDNELCGITTLETLRLLGGTA